MDEQPIPTTKYICCRYTPVGRDEVQAEVCFLINDERAWFHKPCANLKAAAKWVASARDLVRAGYAPRGIPIYEGCPLRPTKPLLVDDGVEAPA